MAFRFAFVLCAAFLSLLVCTDSFIILQQNAIQKKSSGLLKAAPGVQVAPPDILREVLQDGTTTVVDARSLEELQDNGFFRCKKCKWIHAPATPSGAPLMELASGYLIPDKEATVVVYCASGIRAEATRKFLQEAGYTSVYNAGGLSDLAFLEEE